MTNHTARPTPRLTRRGAIVTGAAATWAVSTAGTAVATRDGAPGEVRAGTGTSRLSWRRLPDVPANTRAWSSALPVGEPYWQQVGLAGAVAGTHGDHLIVAGGANFPEPALTATRANELGKVYWNEAFVLHRDGDDHRWLEASLELPDAVAYAATVSTRRGVLVLGGEGFRGGPGGTASAPAQKFADAYYLRYDADAGALLRDDLPDLPRPMSYAVAGIVDDVVYVAEGADAFALDLSRLDDGWTTLPPWPGDPRGVAVGVAQDGRFHLISGRSQDSEGAWRFHRDAYAYDPRRGRWERIADLPWCVTAGLAFPVGRHEVLVVGGDKDIDRWNLIETHSALRNAAPEGSAEWNAHNDVVTWLFDHHTGFNTELLSYDTRRNSWRMVGHFPGSPPATAPAVLWGDQLVVVSGEVGPGIRTPRVWAAE